MNLLHNHMMHEGHSKDYGWPWTRFELIAEIALLTTAFFVLIVIRRRMSMYLLQCLNVKVNGLAERECVQRRVRSHDQHQE